MSELDTQRAIGRLEGEVDSLQRQSEVTAANVVALDAKLDLRVTSVEKKLDLILQKQSEQKGGVKALIAAGTLLSGIGGAVGALVQWKFGGN